MTTEEQRKQKLSEQARIRRAKNPTKYRNVGKKYRQNNRAKVNEVNKRYRDNNPDRMVESRAKFRSKEGYPLYTAIASAKRNRRKKEATPKWITMADFEPLVSLRNVLTRETETLHHLDHIIPLTHPLVSGLNVPANIAIVPHSLNESKGNYFDSEFDWDNNTVEMYYQSFGASGRIRTAFDLITKEGFTSKVSEA